MAFYENGIMRNPEGSVLGLGKDPIGPHPVLPNKGLIPQAIKAAAAPKKSKPQKVLKKPQASLLWSRKMLEELKRDSKRRNGPRRLTRRSFPVIHNLARLVVAKLSLHSHLRNSLPPHRSPQPALVQDPDLDHHAHRCCRHDPFRGHTTPDGLQRHQLGRDILPTRNVFDRRGHGTFRAPRIPYSKNGPALQDATASLGYGTVRDGSTLSLSSQRHPSTHRNAHNARALQTDEDQAECPVDNSRTGRDNRQRDDSRR